MSNTTRNSTGPAGCWFLRAVEDIESCWDVKHPASRVCAILCYHHEMFHIPTLSYIIIMKRKINCQFHFLVLETN
jgi:hypothetical protein